MAQQQHDVSINKEETRITCHTCPARLTRLPHMSDATWKRMYSPFRRVHPHHQLRIESEED